MSAVLNAFQSLRPRAQALPPIAPTTGPMQPRILALLRQRGGAMSTRDIGTACNIHWGQARSAVRGLVLRGLVRPTKTKDYRHAVQYEAVP